MAAMWRSFALFFLALAVLADEPHPTLEIGSPAPNFSLPGIDGKTHSLHDYDSAKLLVIVFTCNHCPTAQLYESRIKKLVDDYRGKGVALVGIEPNNADAIRLDELGYTDVSDSLEEMKIRAAYRHFNFPYLYDGETQSVSKAYGPQATPHVFIFDQERKLRYQGHVDNNQRESLVTHQDARNAIDALLAGKPVPVDHTRAFGCSTKWMSKEADRLAEFKKIEAEPVTLELVSAADLTKLRSNPTGKVLLVNFWATWCGPCVHEFPDLETTWHMYRLRDFDMVMVSANMPDEKPAVMKMLERQHASSRNLLFGSTDTDAMQAAFDPKWQAGVPYTVLLSPDGKALYREQGEVDILKLRRTILANLPDSDYVGHRAYWASQ
ncbi:MAG: redoxin family protein [Acidobacteriaceae bacterium]|nr:redoxin family protein [Acidobacteriaceae bacterium]MBV9502954.1 redoxin family protein [Acidobacteriaceae bacterium]